MLFNDSSSFVKFKSYLVILSCSCYGNFKLICLGGNADDPTMTCADDDWKVNNSCLGKNWNYLCILNKYS